MPFTIHGVQLNEGHAVDIDEYVPLTIQWPGYARLQQAPHSVVPDVGASLVEIKTDRDSGEVVELKLVHIGRLEQSETSLVTPGPIESGVPLMSYAESSQDNSARAVHLHSDGIHIPVGQEPAARAVGEPTAVFGFSERGHLVEFDVGLDFDRMALLRAMRGLVG
ncbi:hypothetical protein [Streptomyces afghaniensis]|uniref:hypothetical protein n=1 Tax=Streptomyces afghaniensis TaxID=66865 RepID=UPI00277F45FA|nr:hypothetical protein [Streptomyces afghaniensis]MDQ1017754.1 hypothetical protein [Streptomyces afghaniensis]